MLINKIYLNMFESVTRKSILQRSIIINADSVFNVFIGYNICIEKLMLLLETKLKRILSLSSFQSEISSCWPSEKRKRTKVNIPKMIVFVFSLFQFYYCFIQLFIPFCIYKGIVLTFWIRTVFLFPSFGQNLFI